MRLPSSSTPSPRRDDGEVFCHGMRGFHAWLVTLTLSSEVLRRPAAGAELSARAALLFFSASNAPFMMGSARVVRTNLFMASIKVVLRGTAQFGDQSSPR